MYEILKSQLEHWGISGEVPEESLKTFEDLLLEWNEKINITRITEKEEVEVKHFLDSLSIFTLGDFQDVQSVIDVGTGGGFPGIPLKLWRKDWEVTLLDSLNKRILFLEEVIDALGLRGIRALHGRAEELTLKPEHREVYDLCVSRAVANMSTLCEYCLPFVKVGKYFLAMKGSEYREELEEGKRALEILGGEVEDIKEITLPGDITHALILLRKVKATPKKYPRGGGKPRKNPL